MRQVQRFLAAAALGLGLLATTSSSADAQTGKSKGGRKATSTANRAPKAAANTARSVATTNAPAAPQYHTHQYNVYPSFAYPVSATPIRSFTGPYAPAVMPSVTYVNHYYIVPTYVPIVTSGAGYYAVPGAGFGSVGTFPPIVPRFADTGPKEATIEVLMTRSDAVLHVDGAKTSTNGLRRFFTSPPLEPGTYCYQVTASWQRAGKEIHMERTVEVAPGGHYLVDFNKIEPATTTPTPD